MATAETNQSADNSKFGVLYEALQDDLKKMLELMNAQQPAVQLIPKMAERLEKIEYDMATVKLTTRVTNDDLKIIKIRTEKLEEINAQLTVHHQRLTALEQAA